MKIVIYGLTITSSWGNGHATTYRSLCRALSVRGHSIHFIEQDAEWYRNDRDLAHPPFCTVHLYRSWLDNGPQMLEISRDADAIVIGSYFPDAIALTASLLEADRRPLLFYDIDTPITLAGLQTTGSMPYLLASSIPHFNAYLSFSGGPSLRQLTEVFSARRAYAFYCSVDPDIYKPVAPSSLFECDLSYLGTFAQDRQSMLTNLLSNAAASAADLSFLVAGAQYPPKIQWPPNIRRISHISPASHPAFYSSSRFTLNLTRREMIKSGWSPSVRLFEASACGTPLISDTWDGLGAFLTPGEEILVPRDAADVVRLLRDTSDEQRRRIGQRARDRVLAEHSSARRASQFEQIVAECTSAG